MHFMRLGLLPLRKIALLFALPNKNSQKLHLDPSHKEETHPYLASLLFSTKQMIVLTFTSSNFV